MQTRSLLPLTIPLFLLACARAPLMGGSPPQALAPDIAPPPSSFVEVAPLPLASPETVLPLPEPAPPPLPTLVKAPSKPRSAALPSGFFNPMPGGIVAGYQADTGLDIAGFHLPVYALASGTLDYSEPGHTLWTGPGDTANCVRFELDEPIAWKGHLVTHVYYAHLSKLEVRQAEGETPRRHVEGGELLGVSGVARRSPHLHIGLLLDGDTSQSTWSTILLADEIRSLLGGYRNGQRM